MTADTSVVVAALSAWHEQHAVAAEAIAAVTCVPAHVLLESYSVLTRLPAGLAVPAAIAADTLHARFADAPLHLADRERGRIALSLSDAGVTGGSSYDGLVALEARANDRTLLTLDRRASETYRRLGATFTFIA